MDCGKALHSLHHPEINRYYNLGPHRWFREWSHSPDSFNCAFVQDREAGRFRNPDRTGTAVLGYGECQYHFPTPVHPAGERRVDKPPCDQLSDMDKVFLPVTLLHIFNNSPLLN